MWNTFECSPHKKPPSHSQKSWINIEMENSVTDPLKEYTNEENIDWMALKFVDS